MWGGGTSLPQAYRHLGFNLGTTSVPHAPPLARGRLDLSGAVKEPTKQSVAAINKFVEVLIKAIFL